MNHLDLCSGIGGWALAFRELGFNTIAFCEIDKYPQQVLQKNFPGIPIFNDLKELTYEDIKERTGVDDIDILTCSYPCQPFSVAGKQKGEEDPRHLWPNTFRLVQECRPTWFVGENVSGHIKLGLDTVLEDLESEGYDTRTFIIPASSVGAWHKRERLWIIGYSEHNGSLATKKSRKHQETARGTSQGQNQAEQSEGASRPSNHEIVSDTESFRTGKSRNINKKKRTQSSSSTQSNSSGEDVSDTESLRLRGRSGQECRSPQWQFLQKEQEGREIWREIEGRSTPYGEDVSDTKSEGLSGSRGQESNTNRARMEQRKGQEQGTIRSKSKRCGGVSTDVSDTDQQRTQIPLEGQQSSIEMSGSTGKENWWQTQSELCGVPDGISYELDKGRVGRIKGLGNAIVPQIAWFIGNAIINHK
jgi:DNA-cytosine methyltransferase